MRLGTGLLFWAATVLLPGGNAASGVIITCVSPEGHTVYVNTACPDGHNPSERWEGSDADPSAEEEEPYICRFASILSEGEIISALTTAQLSLEVAIQSRDRAKRRYWRNCLSSLRERQAEFSADTYRQPAFPADTPACGEGDFEFRDGKVYFTNPQRSACRGLKVLCTFELRERKYVAPTRDIPGTRPRQGYYALVDRQHLEFFDYDGKVGKFGKVEIGDVNVNGRVLGWDCRFR